MRHWNGEPGVEFRVQMGPEAVFRYAISDDNGNWMTKISRANLDGGVEVEERPVASILLVANYAPDVGFAWWLMENFWVHASDVAGDSGYYPILAYPEWGEIPPAIQESGVETVLLRFPGNGLTDLLRSLRFLRSRRVRCIYFTDRAFGSYRYVLFRLAGVRSIINHDHTPGDRPPVGGLKGIVKAVWHRFGSATCDFQICVSPLIRERAIENGKVPDSRAVVVQNGIVPINCSGSRSYAKRSFDLPDSSVICITVGRPHAYKRIDFVIEVANRCVHDLGMRDTYFIHCGDGPDLERLRALATSFGLEKHFIFAGRRTDVKDLLCSADIALHAAQGEAFSLAILEYMSAGLAVLVPDIPSVRQAIRDGETGLLYRDGDAGEAAMLLSRLRASAPLRARLGRAAGDTVRKHYSLEVMNRDFRAIMASELNRVKA